MLALAPVALRAPSAKANTEQQITCLQVGPIQTIKRGQIKLTKPDVRGLVRLRTPSRIGRIDSNCSRLTSLGYGFLGCILLDYRTGNADAYGSADTLATTGL